MKNKHYVKACISFIICICFLVNILSGCNFQKITNKNNDELTTTGFAFNTTYTINLYEGGSQELLNNCISKCTEYENIFSRTLEGSELFYINEIQKQYLKVINTNRKLKKMWEIGAVSYSIVQKEYIKKNIKKNLTGGNNLQFIIKANGYIELKVSELIADIINKGLYYSKLSKGAFDIAIEPVSSLWDFAAENPQVPESDSIENGLKYINYKNVYIKEKKLGFKIAGMGLDLGGIAKGFIADQLKSYLMDNGVKSGMINLGGNVLCIGQKSQDNDFCIGIQQPFADRNETVTAIYVNDMSIVSSGVYERYFKTSDGKMYHHILNPNTGYSYENELIAVTIVSEKSVDGDGLSTTCFALGLEKGLELINKTDNVYALFITSDEKLHYSDGFTELLQ